MTILAEKYPMNKILLTLTIATSLGLIQSSSAVMPGTSSEKILTNNDLILLGHVDSVDVRSGEREYTISVSEFVKTPTVFPTKDKIKAVGCGEFFEENKVLVGVYCRMFEKGQDVMFLLDNQENDDTFKVSNYSFVAPNPGCSGMELLKTRDAKYGLELSQNGENRRFFTDKPIDVTYYARNRQLDDTQYNVTVELFMAGNRTVFAKTFEGTFEECVPAAKLETSFTPIEMGRYGNRVTTSYGGGEISWGLSIVKKETAPMEQYKAHVYPGNVWCKEGLVPAVKTDDTPRRSYDNMPACVTPETKPKLIERGWTEKPHTLQLEPIPVINPNGDTITTINYSIYGGILNSITRPDIFESIILSVTPLSNNGEIILDIPRSLIDSKCKEDYMFNVLLNGEEMPYSEPKTTETHRKITIEFGKALGELEIIGVVCS